MGTSEGSVTGKQVVPKEMQASLWKVWGAGIDTTCSLTVLWSRVTSGYWELDPIT